MDNTFGGLKNVMETVKNSLKETEKYVNTTEVKQMKELLQKFDIDLKDNIDEKDSIMKYETFYDQLNEFVINKRKEIVDIEKMFNTISSSTDGSQFSTIMNKKKENTNEIIDCNNRIVERIRELETTIYNNRMNELDNMKTERYKVIDNEMSIINNSMNVLKQWSNKNTTNILFDSEVDGDGSNNVLLNRVMNRSNLYFITSDENNNIFGGYVGVKIKESNHWITDDNAFVFSLIRDGKVKNKKYLINLSYSNNAFFVYNKDPTGYLYIFGRDIIVQTKGNASICKCNKYEYNYEENPLIDTIPFDRFQTKRIIVIQMN